MESNTSAGTICRSVFKNGSAGTTIVQYTEKWIELINLLEKRKASPGSDGGALGDDMMIREKSLSSFCKERRDESSNLLPFVGGRQEQTVRNG